MRKEYTYFTEVLNPNTGKSEIVPHDLVIETEVKKIDEIEGLENHTGNSEALFYIIRVYSENYNEYTQTFKPNAEGFEAMTYENIDEIVAEQVEAIRNQYKAV